MKTKNHPGKVYRRRERAKARMGLAHDERVIEAQDTRFRVGGDCRDDYGQIGDTPPGFPKQHHACSHPVKRPHIRR